MKPFFCRVGSKRTMVKRVLKLIPEHETYVEPFVGGGQFILQRNPVNTKLLTTWIRT